MTLIDDNLPTGCGEIEAELSAIPAQKVKRDKTKKRRLNSISPKIDRERTSPDL
jgi:hypothetical protein